MSDELIKDTQWYGGVEPMDIGNLDDIKEEKQVIPPTKNVKFIITKADNWVNSEGSLRQINLALKIVDGIDPSGKYKNKLIFTRITYYADTTVYKNDFFVRKQYLISLKYLKNAIGWDKTTIDGHFFDECLNKEVMGDIIVKNRKILVDDGSGNKVEEVIQDNDVIRLKPLSLENVI